MANATGTATIDFGAAPGANEASIAVTGQGTIGIGSKFVVGTATASQTISFVWEPIFGWE